LGTRKKSKQYYIIEVVLFRHLNSQGKNSEYWDDLSFNSENNNETSNLIPTSALAQYDFNDRRLTPLHGGVAALSSAHYKLKDTAAHIKYSEDYHFSGTFRLCLNFTS